MSYPIIESLEARIAPATLTISGPAQVDEGDSSTKTITYTITLSEAAPAEGVTVQVATEDGTATAGSDYVAQNLTVPFLQGETSHTVQVQIKGDTAVEPHETFSVRLSNPTGGATLDANLDRVTTVITNDDLIINPVPDIVAAMGQTSAKVDLGNLFDSSPEAASGYHTFVEFTTNLIDPNAPGVPQKLVLELYNDRAPLTVQNFLTYVTSKIASGDYDGTFFHRLIPGFVLQGGGFDASSPASHINTGPLLHNEFATAWPGYADSANSATASDDLRVNVRGTIAMAKTGLGPNTATSEFFFNLADNSENLDFQNGGFTVFGKLTDSSMHVLDAISALTTKDLRTATGNDALSDVPLQNYTTGTPTTGNLIQITDAKIFSPHDGVSPGYTFSIVGITDADTGLATKLVSGKLTGDTLDLKFKPGASGVAKVQVLATPVGGGVPIAEEFLVTIKPNLIGNSAGTTLPSVVVPGDTGTAKVKITNTGAALAKGKVDVKFYYSHVDGFDQVGNPLGNDPYGLTLDANDVEIGSITGKTISVASGKSTTLAGKVQVPQELVAQQGDQYRIIAVVTTSAGSTIVEQFADDNVTLDGTVHQEVNAFGTFSLGNVLRKNVSTTFQDADGTPVTLKLSGKSGFGQIFPQYNTDHSLKSIDVQLSGTTAASILTATTAKGAGHATLDNIVVSDPIGTVSMANIDLEGSFEAYGGLKSLTLGDMTTGDGTGRHLWIVNSDALAKATPVVRLGTINDVSFESLLPVKSLAAVDWRNTNADHEHIFVPALGSIAINGRLTADVVVTEDVAVKSFTVGGGIESAHVRILGSVGKVSLGAMTDSSFFAGDNGQGKNVGTSVIGSFSIKKTETATGVLSNSLVVAPVFGSVYVQSVAPNSGTEAFGFISHAIRSYQRDTFKLAKIIVDNSATTTAADNIYDQQGNYSVRLM